LIHCLPLVFRQAPSRRALGPVLAPCPRALEGLLVDHLDVGGLFGRLSPCPARVLPLDGSMQALARCGSSAASCARRCKACSKRGADSCTSGSDGLVALVACCICTCSSGRGRLEGLELIRNRVPPDGRDSAGHGADDTDQRGEVVLEAASGSRGSSQHPGAGATLRRSRWQARKALIYVLASPSCFVPFARGGEGRGRLQGHKWATATGGPTGRESPEPLTFRASPASAPEYSGRHLRCEGSLGLSGLCLASSSRYLLKPSH